MICKRGKTYWYNFRWTIKNSDGTSEHFRIRRTANIQNKNARPRMLRTNIAEPSDSERSTPMTPGRSLPPARRRSSAHSQRNF